MSRRLPLFVLDMVLFPGAPLSLHVFEPRYRRLLDDLLADDGRFGVLPPGPDDGRPSPGAPGCIGRVVSHQPLPDGHANLLVTGESRFLLRRILDEPHEYFVGLVDEFGDEEGANELPGDTVAALRHLAERCRDALRVLTDRPDDDHWSADPAVLTFQMAAAIPWSTEQARQLLTLRSAAQRADVLLRVLPRVVPDLEGRAAVHRRASRNGKGGHSPVLEGEP